MQINQIQKTNSELNHTNFNGIRIPTKVSGSISDDTLKMVSASVLATGVAGLMINLGMNDYINSIASAVDKASLSKEDKKYITDLIKEYPLLADTILSSKNKRREIRDLDRNLVEMAKEAYQINPELTLDLLVEKDEAGCHKYIYSQVKSIVKASTKNPEFYQLARKNSKFVQKLMNKVDSKNNPVFGLEDIKTYVELYDVAPDFVSKLSGQAKYHGGPRVNGEELKYLVANREKDKEFIDYLLNKKADKNTPGLYMFDGKDIVNIHKAGKPELAKKIIETNVIANKYCFLSTEEILFLLNNDLDDIAIKYHGSGYLYSFLKLMDGVNEEEYKNLLNMRDNNARPIISKFVIQALRPESLKDKVLVEDMMYKYSNYRLNDEQYKLIQEIYKKDSSLVESILSKEHRIPNNSKSSSFTYYKFNINEALGLFQYAKEDFVLVKEAINRLEGSKIIKYSPEDVFELIEKIVICSRKIPREKVEALLEETKTYHKTKLPKYNTLELYEEMQKLIKN